MRVRWFIGVAVLLILTTLYGCATTSDLEVLREGLRLVQKNTTDLQRKSDQHNLRLEGIDNSLQMLETRVEDNTTRIEDLKATLASESVGDIRVSPPPPIPAPPVTPVSSEPPKGAPAVETPPPYPPRLYTRGEDLYNSAYGHYEKAEYGQAILEFEEYVANYGKTELADNAQYWIGECYYAQKDYKQSIREFEKVEKNFPKGNKVPAAKLKKGLAYRELGNPEEASRELKEVASKYPESEEALLANEKLKLWK